MNLIDELSETIKVLEDRIPASPQRNERLEKQFEKGLSEYFRNLDNGLDWNTLEQIYYRHVQS